MTDKPPFFLATSRTTLLEYALSRPNACGVNGAYVEKPLKMERLRDGRSQLRVDPPTNWRETREPARTAHDAPLERESELKPAKQDAPFSRGKRNSRGHPANGKRLPEDLAGADTQEAVQQRRD